MLRARLLVLPIITCLALSARADGPRDNIPSQVRPIPPIGNDLQPNETETLQAGVDALGREIDALRERLKYKPQFLAYLPDVQIFYNAVQYPLAHHETIEVALARAALADGMERAKELREGRTPWVAVTGPRGFVSRIDGSVQPYVLSVPTDYKPEDKAAGKRYRMDVWGHGRDELLTELRFISQASHLFELRYLHQPLESRDKFVLSPYGRYITAYKFAGEVDGLEAMDAVRRAYPIDDDCVLCIGFSMGGAMTWEYATHYTDLWAAACPGAGFSETRRFLESFQKEDVSNAPWYQQALWHWYDCTDYVANLSNLPTIAYAGELDPQKQASDVMLEAAAAEGVKVDRVVGKGIGHHYTPDAKAEIDRRLDEIISHGRDSYPEQLRFTTYTLRYNRMLWLTVDGLEHHWHRANVEASRQGGQFTLKTSNVTALTLTLPSIARNAFAPRVAVAVTLDGQRIGTTAATDGSYSAHFVRDGEGWHVAEPASGGLQKRHGLQGPIDDAFTEPFLIVRPTGKPLNERIGAWVKAECNHAIDHWFKQFRGQPRVKDDVDVTDDDLRQYNVVLFGDPSSNKVLARVAEKLPVHWTADSVQLGERTFAADQHVPVLIYPNPLNEARYVVFNSGFTYREYDYLNNARQTPKLPDYAVIDVTVPATSQVPGGIAAAGFFDERWQLQANDGRGAVDVPAAL